jgi:hypothetical protein
LDAEKARFAAIPARQKASNAIQEVLEVGRNSLP